MNLRQKREDPVFHLVYYLLRTTYERLHFSYFLFHIRHFSNYSLINETKRGCCIYYFRVSGAPRKLLCIPPISIIIFSKTNPLSTGRTLKVCFPFTSLQIVCESIICSFCIGPNSPLYVLFMFIIFSFPPSMLMA